MSNKKRKWLLPILHIMAVLLYAVFGAKHTEYPYAIPAQIYDSPWSDGMERLFHMGMSALYGIILIFLVWKVFFLLLSKKRKMPFFLIFAAFVICVLVFPSNFSYEPDNFTNYSYAVRNISDYWQNVHVGYLYRACLWVFPHPLVLPVIQLCSLLGAIYYISVRVKRLFGKTASYVPYCLIAFPEFLEIGTNPYRNNIYTVMCIWFFAILFLDCLEQRKRKGWELACLCVAGGFLTVFRSEGIVLLGVVFFALWLLYRLDIRKTALYFALCLCACLLFAFPQKLGEKKYYGGEYSMINSMNMLKEILSNPNADYTYGTAEEDLTAINRVVSLDALMVYGIQGYRANNYEIHQTINQSCVTLKEQEDFISAARNIIFHNPGIFLMDRIAMFCESNGVLSDAQDPYPTEEWNKMFAALLEQWNFSYNEIISDAFPKSFFYNKAKVSFADQLTDLQVDYYNLLCDTKILIISRLLVFLLFPVIVIYDVRLCGKKERSFFIGAALMLLFQLAAVILFSPEGRGPYYYPSYFVMLSSCFLLALDVMRKSKAVRRMEPPVTNRLGTMP